MYYSPTKTYTYISILQKKTPSDMKGVYISKSLLFNSFEDLTGKFF